jgi:hypothetical protein
MASPAPPLTSRPPRVLRSHGAALGMALVAALDESPLRAAALPPPVLPTLFPRPRSDSSVSSDTFDGIYALGDDDVGSVDVDDVDMDDLTAESDDLDAFGLGGRGTSDLERLLLLGSGRHGDEPTAHDRMDDADMSAQVDDDEAAAVMAHLAQLDAQHKQGRLDALLPHGVGRRMVVHGSHTDVALPPRGVDTKRRVHTRTFGDRMGSFRFRFATARPTSPVKATAAATAVIGTVRSRASPVKPRRARTLFQEAAEDLARRRDVVDEEEDAKESATACSSVDAHMMDETESEAEEEQQQGEDKVEIKMEPETSRAEVHTPVRTDTTATASDAFQTPLRRVASHDPCSFLTPSTTALCSSVSTTSGTASTSMSPAPSFDKVAVIHATDSRGKVDKFEWTVRSRSSSSVVAQDTTLPPPYLSDATKRRVHSSTFGSFARSFSFPTTTP